VVPVEHSRIFVSKVKVRTTKRWMMIIDLVEPLKH